MALPPPQPTYILRGHTSSITSLNFFQQNLRLVSADAEGWVVVWDVGTKRAVAVWRAHGEGVLGVGVWGGRGEEGEREGWRVVSHGPDNTLCVWQLPLSSSSTTTSSPPLSTRLPADSPDLPRQKPWLLHLLRVESVGFCSFAACEGLVGYFREDEEEVEEKEGEGAQETEGEVYCKAKEEEQPLLIALPAEGGDGAIALYTLPSSRRFGVVTAPNSANGKTGMVMCLQIFFSPAAPSYSSTTTTTSASTTQPPNRTLHVLAGYESGRLHLFRHSPSAGAWEPIYTHLPHSQPLLSLALPPSLDCFYTSGADSVISKHILEWEHDDNVNDGVSENKSKGERENVVRVSLAKEVKTRHAGQQSLRVRDDGGLVVTAGWDGRGRVYAGKGLREVAVLKWHKEGCYAVAFGEVVGARRGVAVGGEEGGAERREREEGGDGVVAVRETGLVRVDAGEGLGGRLTVVQARERKVRETHWIALGSKDGKISLWDIY